MLYATFLYMQGLIEFTLSTGYIIGPAVGGGLNEVRVLECMYAYAWLAIIVCVMCVCVTLEL